MKLTHLVSQYFKAFPGYAAKLDQPLDPGLDKGWKTLPRENQLSAGRLTQAGGLSPSSSTDHP